MMINYSETDGFARDFKKLLKKFSSLAEDLEIVKQYDIELFHCQKIDKRGIFKIESVGNNEKLQFYKIKKFACKALKDGVQKAEYELFTLFIVKIIK